MDIEYTFKAGNKDYTAIAIFTEYAKHPGWGHTSNNWGRYKPGTIKILIFRDYLINRNNTTTKAGDLVMEFNIDMTKYYTKEYAKKVIENDIVSRFTQKWRDMVISDLLEMEDNLYD